MTNQDPFRINFDNPGGQKLVGGYFPRSLADYIAILAIYDSSSVSTVLRRMIDEYIENREDEAYMIRVLVNRAYKEWMRRLQENQHKKLWQGDNKMKRYREYCEEMYTKLLKRNISPEKALVIVDQLKTTYDPYQIN